MSSPPIDIPRPSSAQRRRNVNLSNHFDPIDDHNPEPIKTDPSDLILEEYLSPRRLKELTGVDDLKTVEFLEMQVNTAQTTLGNFGHLLPNMQQLKLSGSSISNFRDIGSGIEHLHVLWMNNCGCIDIDGISSLCNLRELYLAYNQLSDISPCSMLDDVRVLDLEGNLIDDFVQVEFLSLCSNLQTLILDGNPICKDDAKNYRTEVFKRLPQLQHLDEESDKKPPQQEEKSSQIKEKQSSPPQRPTTATRKAIEQFESDWSLINECIRDGALSTGSTIDSGLASPGYRSQPLSSSSGSDRPATSAATYRPGTAFNNRPSTAAMRRPSTGVVPRSNPSTSSSVTANSEVMSDLVSSLLSRGTVICGNPVRALRNRQRTPTTPPSRQSTPNSDVTGASVFEELQQWRREYETRRTKLDEAQKPQILKITHEESEEGIESDLDESDQSDSTPTTTRPGTEGHQHKNRPVSSSAMITVAEGGRRKVTQIENKKISFVSTTNKGASSQM